MPDGRSPDSALEFGAANVLRVFGTDIRRANKTYMYYLSVE